LKKEGLFMDILEILQDLLEGFESQRLVANTDTGTLDADFFHKDKDLTISIFGSSHCLEIQAWEDSQKVGDFTVLKNGGKITNNKITGPLPDVEIILSRLALRLISEFQN
jgi:hypothetical protein